jgi:hypothetical protein
VSPARQAGKVPAATMCGVCELDRARLHAERAAAELKAARQAWGVWAEGIRRRAEKRLGVTDFRDQRVMDDLEYTRALDMGTAYIEAVTAAEAALKAGRCSGGDGDAGGAVPAGLPASPDKRK